MIFWSTRCRNWRACEQARRVTGKKWANGAICHRLMAHKSLSFMSNDSHHQECRLQQTNSSDSNKKAIHMFATIWPGDYDQSCPGKKMASYGRAVLWPWFHSKAACCLWLSMVSSSLPPASSASKDASFRGWTIKDVSSTLPQEVSSTLPQEASSTRP